MIAAIESALSVNLSAASGFPETWALDVSDSSQEWRRDITVGAGVLFSGNSFFVRATRPLDMSRPRTWHPIPWRMSLNAILINGALLRHRIAIWVSLSGSRLVISEKVQPVLLVSPPRL